jgi:hypothetical protein
MDRPKFLVDRMLGRLVAWLRIFDYDTLSALELDIGGDEDAGLVQKALEQGRVLVTRDRALLERARKAGASAVLITPDDVKEQLCELMRHYHLEANPVMERCTACNARLRMAAPGDADHIRAGVPAHLIDEGKELWMCDRCGKIYWQGSHWRNIKKLAGEVRDCRK